MADLKPLMQGLNESTKKQKRCLVTVEFYIWVESDQEAIEEAEYFAQLQRNDSDNQCKVVSVHDASTHKPRKIK